jgi:hypothetical protein
MATKLLFIFVIVAAHCAVASGWVRPESPKDKLAMASCVKSPTALPMFTPPRELLAMTFEPVVYAERMQP